MHLISCFKNPSCLPVKHFISGGAGFGKSRLIKAIYQSVMRIYRSEPGPVNSNEVMLVAYTGMAAHNIDRNIDKFDLVTICISWRISPCRKSNKLTIIDEISFLSSKHFHQMSSNMKQAFKSKKESLK